MRASRSGPTVATGARSVARDAMLGRMEPPTERFVRLQATYRGRLGVEVGIFVAVDHLRRADRLTDVEEQIYFDVDDWFRAALPNPPFYADGNQIGAVTWFKEATSAEMLERLAPLVKVLDKHGVEWTEAESLDPGTVIYEDVFQIGVIPYERYEPTPMPEMTVLGPTTAGSKRHLGRAARRAGAQSAEGAVSSFESEHPSC
jgi:hypothetical protein